MTSFNICLVKPDQYIHSFAFLELGELLYFSLKELGFKVALQFNEIAPHEQNIVIGFHLLAPQAQSQLPKSTIILNTEQVHSDQSSWNETIMNGARHFKLWDYSQKNIEKFQSMGIQGVKYLKLGFQKELARLDRTQPKSIDVLFYGSVNERRRDILKKLEAQGVKLKVLLNVYGKQRDHWIERSKMVINLHHYNSHIFEIVRVFYLLTNAVAVVSEVNESTSIDENYKAGIKGVPYEALIENCMAVINKPSLLQALQNAAFTCIQKYPQKYWTEEVLSS
ncbi:MAG: hypothetical protein WCH96_01020 [Betaproteobacteria bacterium]|jgi:hypothetical protein